MKILIVGGGIKPSSELIIKEYEKSDIVIAADRGAQYLFEENLNPTILLGDFDSINKEVLEKLRAKNSEIKVYPPEKDFTDSEIAVDLALEYKPEEVTLLGCTGSRLDHVLGNIGLLYKCLGNGSRAYIKDDNNIIFLVNKSTKLKKKNMNYISFQGFREEVKNFNIRNAKYDLHDYDLNFGETISVSNEFLDEKDVEITFNNGIVMVMYSMD
ncbi:thiamine diphosphokinase [Clostridium frigidicarnis]|uniref:Thiamine diphosphokinase n=1 Tax=Clostridium frigidicarnis TaxID=84698 RepID=A0A1I0ZN67_9CLOT|nr:thiamine diphosphokinase [Clostridium frigidicarnis]SFB26937.1 thiamine diphosphokinase [Clostridium frigidicarnis]